MGGAKHVSFHNQAARKTTSDARMATEARPEIDLARLVDGYLSTQLLYVAVKLGIAEVLAAGPRTSDDIAAAVGADPAALRRVLRGLAADGVLDEEEDGRFRLNPAGERLRDGVPGSVRGQIQARGDLYFRAAAGLLGAVREGGIAFEREYGEEFFSYLAARPEQSSAFQASMADRSRREAAAVVSAYDFGGLSRIVDVGGGTGVLLGEILAANPSVRGVLFDRPEVVEQATEALDTAGLAGRFEVVGGDFFTALPVDGDAYLLSRVVHDWDDADAGRILASCHRAMPADGRLLLIDAILPERAIEQPAVIRMDINMLLFLHGRERTAAEFDRLLAENGYRMTRVIGLASTAGIGIIEAVRETAPPRKPTHSPAPRVPETRGSP